MYTDLYKSKIIVRSVNTLLYQLILIFTLIFFSISIYGETGQNRKIIISFSQLESIKSDLPPKELFRLKNLILSILQKGKGLYSSGVALPKDSDSLLEPLFIRNNDRITFWHYGISVRKCDEGNAAKLDAIFNKCFPKINDSSFFSDPYSATYLVELQLLKNFSDSEEVFWINIGEPYHDSKIPDIILEELESLQESVGARKVLFKYQYKKNISIVIRQIEKLPTPLFSLKDQALVVLKENNTTDSIIEIISEPIQLQTNRADKYQISNIFLEIKTLNNRLFRMKPLTDASSLSYTFKGSISSTDRSLLEKKAGLRIEYLLDSQKKTQVIKNISFQIIKSSTASTKYLWILIPGSVTLSLCIIFLISYKKMKQRKNKKTTAIKIYKIDSASINAKQYRLSEGQKIAFGSDTYKQYKCSVLYDLGIEGHFIELLSARSNRFSHTNQIQDFFREFVLPADIELRNEKGKLIRISIEILDKNNSFIISV